MASQLESRAEKFAAAAMSSCSDEELGQSMNSYYDDVSRLEDGSCRRFICH